MIKLITFDLDGTLAELGSGIKEENQARLKQLESRGIRIALCSGKPTYYLCGFLRQVGLEHPVLAGENGSVIQFGIDLPPKQFYIQDYTQEAKKTISFLKKKLEEEMPDLWYQPNLVGLTPFPKREEQFDQIQKMIDDNMDQIKGVDIYRHIDCFDFMPVGLSKKTGMTMLGELLDIQPEETVCVGDGVNDYPMFEYAGYSIGIHLEQEDKVDKNVANIDEALLHLLDITEKKYVIDSKENKTFLNDITNTLLAFGHGFASPGGGSYYLGDDGTPWKDRPRETWITSRMAHVYSLGSFLGHEGSEELAAAAIKGLRGELHDDVNGGWYAGLTADDKILPTKQCYAHAFVILAATSGILAKIPGAEELLEDALAIYDRYFWNEEEGMSCDLWDTEFSNKDSYRGLNANMHSVEAFLAVADATGREEYRVRAGRIIDRVLEFAAGNRWRIPEHYNEQWIADLECNKDKPDDQFKPYGATPGHGIEWSRLITQWALSTFGKGFSQLEEIYKGVSGATKYIDAAENLFQRAIADAWDADGNPGIVYTTGWDGTPIVHDRMHWTLAEAINTSACLYHVTRKPVYAQQYAEFMKYLDEKVLDHVNGSWFHQLDQENRVLDTVWPGKSDLYHALQATLIPYYPANISIAPAVKAGLKL